MSKAFQKYEIPGQDLPSNDFSAAPTGVPVGTSDTQTLTNKTLTTPTVTYDVQVVAAVGTNQATAAAVTATYPGVVYATGGNNAVGIVLPATPAGGSYKVKNGASDILFVYPGVNCTINAIAANTKIDMASVTSCEFVKINTTAWMTFPLLPS